MPISVLLLSVILLIREASPTKNSSYSGEIVAARDPRIQYGSPAGISTFVGALIRPRNLLGVEYESTFCTATIITANRLLTAAHCVDFLKRGDIRKFVWGLADVRQFTIFLNQSNRQVQTLEFNGSDIVIHKSWKKGIFGPNDIAIIKLRSSLDLSRGIKPVCLAKSERTSEIMALGYGHRNCFYNSANILKIARGRIVDRETCTRFLPGLGEEVITPAQICSLFASNLGLPAAVASGDSGGPLYSTSGSEPVQIGVLSFGPYLLPRLPPIWQCSSLLAPSVYTKVLSFQDFIRENAPEARFC